MIEMALWIKCLIFSLQHDLECLSKIAALIGETDLEQKILDFAVSSENDENFESFRDQRNKTNLPWLMTLAMAKN